MLAKLINFFRKPEPVAEEDPVVEKPQPSEIAFVIDKDLKIQVRTTINPEIKKALIENEYLNEKTEITSEAIKLAMVLISHEVTESIIEDINAEYDNVAV